jgi:hypothetical protein
MRPSAQDKRNRLPMNRLRARTSFSNQGQSCPIVPNRVIFLNRSAHTHHSITPPLLPEFGIRVFRVFRGRLPFHLFPLNSSYFHFAAPPGGATTFIISPPGQTWSNPVKPQKPGLTRSDPVTEIRRFLSVPSVKPVRRRPGEGGSAVRFLCWQWPLEKGPAR